MNSLTAKTTCHSNYTSSVSQSIFLNTFLTIQALMMKNSLLPLRFLHPAVKVSRRRYTAASSGALGKLNVPTDYSASSYLAHTSSQTYNLHTDLPTHIRSSKTKRTNYFTAVNDALRTILTTDDKSLIFGEDVSFGGVFRCTSNLTDSFGGSRIFNTPLSEQGIIGFAIGLSTSGYTALPEIQFADYLFPAFDQLHNEASKMRYRSGGAENFNAGRMVVRMPTGAVGHGALYHSQSPEGFFLGMQGITVIIPRSPVQAKGLLIAAARGADPVVIMEPKILYRAAVEEVPLEEYELPIGKAEVLQAGTDVTLVTYGTMVYVAEAAARAAKERFGVSVEVIDLRTVRPWDKETITKSVNKTGRCVVVHEASRTGGVGESIAGEVQERCFLRLEAPVTRVTGWDTHMPLAFEEFMVPDVVRVLDGIKKTVKY